MRLVDWSTGSGSGSEGESVSRAAVRIVASASLLLGLLGLAASAAAQPLAWSVQQRAVGSPPSAVDQLVVFNFATGVDEALFTIPSGVTTGEGVLTPDGRYYLLPTNVGIARFLTNPPALDRLLAPGVPVTSLAIEPVGARLHATGAFGHAVLDWESGALIGVTCCTQPRIVFSPDGATSVYLEVVDPASPEPMTRITVYSEPEHAERWSHTEPGRTYQVAVSDTDIAVTLATVMLRPAPRFRVWGLSDGVLRTAQFRFPLGLAWSGNEILISERGLIPEDRLIAHDPATGTERIVASVTATRDGPGAIAVGPDLRAYWFQLSGTLGLLTSTLYNIVDLADGSILGQGLFGKVAPTGIAIESAPLCRLSVPGTAAAPAEGGTVAIPVVPDTGCRSWTAPTGLNPGPHTGPATILVPLAPNTGAGARIVEVWLAGTAVRIEQPAMVPGAPTLEIERLQDGRVSLTWTPAPGGGVTAWVIRGATSGGTLVHVATVEASGRTWTSPPLPSGSFDLEVVAVNNAGLSPASNRVRFSVGVTELPAQPAGLLATVADNSVSLEWTAASAGPAPEAYVLEAAGFGSPTFVPVATTTMPWLVVPDAPIGTWSVRVRARTAGGLGEPSAPITFTTAACTSAPSQPIDVWAVSTLGTATVRWSPPSGSAVRDYIIEVGSALGASDLAQIVVGGHVRDVTAPVVGGPVAAVAQVRARNACGTGPPSAPVAIPGR